MRRLRYDDFFKEDHLRECVHGAIKHCPECEAEGAKIAKQESREKLSMLILIFVCGWGAGFACAFQLFA